MEFSFLLLIMNYWSFGQLRRIIDFNKRIFGSHEELRNKVDLENWKNGE